MNINICVKCGLLWNPRFGKNCPVCKIENTGQHFRGLITTPKDVDEFIAATEKLQKDFEKMRERKP